MSSATTRRALLPPKPRKMAGRAAAPGPSSGSDSRSNASKRAVVGVGRTTLATRAAMVLNPARIPEKVQPAPLTAVLNGAPPPSPMARPDPESLASPATRPVRFGLSMMPAASTPGPPSSSLSRESGKSGACSKVDPPDSLLNGPSVSNGVHAPLGTWGRIGVSRSA